MYQWARSEENKTKQHENVRTELLRQNERLLLHSLPFLPPPPPPPTPQSFKNKIIMIKLKTSVRKTHENVKNELSPKEASFPCGISLVRVYPVMLHTQTSHHCLCPEMNVSLKSQDSFLFLKNIITKQPLNQSFIYTSVMNKLIISQSINPYLISH